LSNVVVMVHDLQPINHPSFFSDSFSRQFRKGLTEVIQLATTIVANSSCTSNELQQWAERTGMVLPSMFVAPLGVRDIPFDLANPPTPEELFFVTLGIADPRKNFNLLRTVWSDLESPPVLLCLGEPSESPQPEG